MSASNSRVTGLKRTRDGIEFTHLDSALPWPLDRDPKANKDMLLALEMGRQLDVPLPTTAISNEFLTAARAMGMAKQDFAVMFDVLARMSGVSK